MSAATVSALLARYRIEGERLSIEAGALHILLWIGTAVSMAVALVAVYFEHWPLAGWWTLTALACGIGAVVCRWRGAMWRELARQASEAERQVLRELGR